MLDEFTLADRKWSAFDWWRQMDPNDDALMYQLGMFVASAPANNPIFQIGFRNAQNESKRN